MLNSRGSIRNLAILVLLSFQCAAQNQTAPDAGEKLFMAHCTVCHGPKGNGGESTNLAQPRLPRAPDDEALARVITFVIPWDRNALDAHDAAAGSVRCRIRSLARLFTMLRP